MSTQAAAAREVPVGAVLVFRGQIVARAHNGTAATGSPIAHAEVLCIQQAAATLASWRAPPQSCRPTPWRFFGCLCAVCRAWRLLLISRVGSPLQISHCSYH